MKQVERDAQEFGRFLKQGGWRLGLLVARNVHKGTGGPRTVSVGTVSAREFAEMAGTTAARVLRHLKAWEQAAAEGLVPSAADLKPNTEPSLDIDKLPSWSDFYDASDAGGRPRDAKQALRDPAQRQKVIESMTEAEATEMVEAVFERKPAVESAVMKSQPIRTAERILASTPDVTEEYQRIKAREAEMRPDPPAPDPWQEFWPAIRAGLEMDRRLTEVFDRMHPDAWNQPPNVIEGIERDSIELAEKLRQQAEFLAGLADTASSYINR